MTISILRNYSNQPLPTEGTQIAEIFTSVADMKASSLLAGVIVETSSYRNTGPTDVDGAAIYKVVTAAEFGATPDEFGDHTLANGNIAVLQSEQSLLARQYGCRDTGDNAGSINALIAASAAQSKPINWQSGTYTTESPHTVDGCVGMFSDGDATIVANYEQTPASTVLAESLFSVSNTDGFYAKDFNIEYTGTFDQGTGGLVAGIYVVACDNILIENIGATGFNHSGISVGFEGAVCVNPIIRKNRCDSNRLAGIFWGFSNGAMLAENHCSSNGLQGDPGTGYGMAATSSSEVTNCTVINNFTSFNFRKGIDMHSHENCVVSDNISFKDILFGIYVIGRARPAATCVVTNNVVICDPNSLNVNLAYNAIQVGIDSSAQAASQPMMTVANNQIFNLDKTPAGIAGNAVVGISTTIGISTANTGQVQIHGNIIRGANCDPIRHDNTTDGDAIVKIFDNDVLANAVDSAISVLNPGTHTISRVYVEDNNLQITTVNNQPIISSFGFTETIFSNNTLNGKILNDCSKTNFGDEKQYRQRTALSSGVPTLVFDQPLNGDAGTLFFYWDAYYNDGAGIGITSGMAVISMIWTSTPNSFLTPIITEVVNQQTAGLAATVTFAVAANGGAFHPVEVTATASADVEFRCRVDALGQAFNLQVNT